MNILKKEKFAFYLALIVVISYAVIMIGTTGLLINSTFGEFNKEKVDTYKDILQVIAGVFSMPVGLILGFYFKDTISNTIAKVNLIGN